MYSMFLKEEKTKTNDLLIQPSSAEDVILTTTKNCTKQSFMYTSTSTMYITRNKMFKKVMHEEILCIVF